MFDINGTLVIFLIMYGLFIVALNEVMLKPIGKALEARAAKIQADLDASKQSQAQAQEVVAQFEQHVAEKRSKAQKVIVDTMAEAQKKRDQALKELADKNRMLLDAAKEKFQGERLLLMDDALAQEEVTLVKMMVDKILGESTMVSLSKTAALNALKEAH